MPEGNRLFPIFLKLNEVRVLVVGGGNVGFEKIATLLKNDPTANITLVAPTISKDIHHLLDAAPNHAVRLIERVFVESDLALCDIVIVALNHSKKSKEIKEQAEKAGKLVNVADTPALCHFYLGSTVQKGDLKIGISTNGKSPTLAKRVRAYFEMFFPDDFQDLMDNLHEIRQRLVLDFKGKILYLNRLTSRLLKK